MNHSGHTQIGHTQVVDMLLLQLGKEMGLIRESGFLFDTVDEITSFVSCEVPIHH